MACPAVQLLLVTAASLLVPSVVMAERDVVITVSSDGVSSYFYYLGFNISLFTEFHECLSKGTINCVADYREQYCPNCIIETVRSSGTSYENLQNHHYKCTNNLSTTALNCHRQTTIPVTLTESYILRNSSYPSRSRSTCFGFVWTLGSEGISFNSNQWDVEFCGAKCACPSRSTTSQPGTATTFLSSSPTGSVSSAPVTSSPSNSSTPSATTQRKSPTTTPTEPTLAVSTTNYTSILTESSTDKKNSGDDPPIAVIVGAVVGVVAVIVIIIIIVVVCRRRSSKAKSSDHANQETSAVTSNGVGVNGKTNYETSHSYNNTDFLDSSGELQTANTGANKINGYHNALQQPNITKNGEAQVKDPPKPLFAIKDNDSDFGYSTAQLVVPESNNNTKDKKTHDNYDYVSVEDDAGVPDPKPEATRAKNPAVNPPKVKDDYAVVDKTQKTDSDLDFGYEYSRTSDGYSTAGDVNQANPNNDDPNATSVYSKLHQEVRNIQNPYNVGPNTNDVYSKLHEEDRDIKNPYNVLPEAQGTSDINSALPDTAHNAHDTKKAKPSKSLPYGKEDYAVVVKTKSTNKPTQASFQLRNDEN